MENIKVSLRVRPFNERETRIGERSAWEVTDATSIQALNENISNPQSRTILQNALSFNKQLRFSYDRCFDESASNKFIYENCVQSILKSSLNGVNGTIFMYGQSGSGKTYTMMGYEKKYYTQQQQQQNQSLQNSQHSSHSHSQQTQTHRKRSFGGAQSPLSKNTNISLGLSGTNNQVSQANYNSNNNYEIDDIDFDRIKSNTPQDNQGVLILALQDFFETIRVDEDKTYVVRCSYVEIYNDMIYDLLNPVNKLSEVLQVGMNTNKEFYIKGVTQKSVSSLEEAYDVLRIGETNKHYAQTTMNHHSSRSHSIFKLYVQSISSTLLKTCMPRRSSMGQSFGGGGNVAALSQAQQNVNNQELLQKLNEHDATLVSTSELNFIDLAGSERISNHSNLEEILLNDGERIGGGGGRTPTGSGQVSRDVSPSDLIKDRVKEGQYINKSLFFLTQVISQIAEGKPLTHIPYRNSPLTKILKSSLGGNSRTNIILCITPAQSQFEQSYSTIRFGLNAKKIENKVRVNIQAKNSEEAMQMLILDYEKKIRDLEQQKYEEKCKNREILKKLHEVSAVNSVLQVKLQESAKKISDLQKPSTQQPTSARGDYGMCPTCQKLLPIASAGTIAAARLESEKQSSSLPCNSRSRQRSGNSLKGLADHPISSQTSQFGRQAAAAAAASASATGAAASANSGFPVTSKKREALKNEKTLFSDSVGVLFASQKNNISFEDVSPPLRRDFQELIFDYEGRYAFHQYQVRNRQLTQYLRLWEKVESNIEAVIKYCINIYHAALNVHAGGQIQTNTAATKTVSIQKFDLTELTDNEIAVLEKSLQTSIESAICERFKRRLIQNHGATIPSANRLLNYIDVILPEKIKEWQTTTTSTTTKKQPQQQQSSHQQSQSESHSILTDEQIRVQISQLFYTGVDVKSLLCKDIDLSEVDFKHLKCIANRDLYSEYNILQSEKESIKRAGRHNRNEQVPSSKEQQQQPLLSQRISKSASTTPTKKLKQTNEIEEEMERKGYSGFADSLTHSQSIEDRLRYHQKPIPKEQEDEIQQNYEKLQNQSFFEGYSMISNAQPPSQPQTTTSISQHQSVHNQLPAGLLAPATGIGMFNSIKFPQNSNSSSSTSVSHHNTSSNIITTFSTTVVTQQQLPIHLQQQPLSQQITSNNNLVRAEPSQTSSLSSTQSTTTTQDIMNLVSTHLLNKNTNNRSQQLEVVPESTLIHNRVQPLSFAKLPTQSTPAYAATQQQSQQQQPPEQAFGTRVQDVSVGGGGQNISNNLQQYSTAPLLNNYQSCRETSPLSSFSNVTNNYESYNNNKQQPFRKDSPSSGMNSDSIKDTKHLNSPLVFGGGMSTFDNAGGTNSNTTNSNLNKKPQNAQSNPLSFLLPALSSVAPHPSTFSNGNQSNTSSSMNNTINPLQLNFNRLETTQNPMSNYNSASTTPTNGNTTSTNQQQPQSQKQPMSSYPFSFSASSQPAVAAVTASSSYATRPTIPTYKTLDNPMNSFQLNVPPPLLDLEGSQSSKRMQQEFQFSEIRNGGQPHSTLNTSFASSAIPNQIEETPTALQHSQQLVNSISSILQSHNRASSSSNHNNASEKSNSGTNGGGNTGAMIQQSASQLSMPKKRSIQLNNTISIDIIQAQGTSLFNVKSKQQLVNGVSPSQQQSTSSQLGANLNPASNSINPEMESDSLNAWKNSAGVPISKNTNSILENSKQSQQARHTRVHSNFSQPTEPFVASGVSQQRHNTPQPTSSKSAMKIHSVDPTGLLTNYSSNNPALGGISSSTSKNSLPNFNENIVLSQFLRSMQPSSAQVPQQVSLK